MKEVNNKILFVNPSFFFIDEYHKDLYYHDIPIDLIQLSSFLKEKINFPYEFLDIRFERCFENILTNSNLNKELFQKKLISVLEEVSIQEFKNIIIIVDSSYKYLQTKLIGEITKKEFDDINIIVGGHHPTALSIDFTYDNSPFDYVIIGELENNFLELIKSQKLTRNIKKKSPEKINTLNYLKLDALPFPDYQLYLDKYPFKDHFKIQLNMSKGCPFNCNFCRIDKTSSIRNYSLPVFLQRFEKLLEITPVYNRNFLKISFTDQTFNSAKFSKVILNYIIKNNLQEIFNFSCQSRIEIVHKNQELIDLIKKSQMVVGYGFETANNKLLRDMNKTNNPTKYLKKTKEIINIYKNDSMPSCRLNVIAGFPGEDHVSFNDTISFLVEHALHENIEIGPTLYFNDPMTNVYSNQDYYEKKYGTQFSKDWWKIESDSLLNSILPKPSRGYSKLQLIEDYKDNYSFLLTKFKGRSFKALINWRRYFNKCYEELSNITSYK